MTYVTCVAVWPSVFVARSADEKVMGSSPGLANGTYVFMTSTKGLHY